MTAKGLAMRTYFSYTRRPTTLRRGGGVVERVGLENRSSRKATVGSNPTLSAIGASSSVH